MKQTAVTQIMTDIKEYVMSLDTPDNPYKNNHSLMLACFAKALEICEERLPMEKEQIKDAYNVGFTDGSNDDFYFSEQYYNETYKK